MGPFRTFQNALVAKWAEIAYATPLRYGYREAQRSRDLDAVTLGNGRIVWHAGTWPGPESSAGEIVHEHRMPTTTGKSVSTSWNIFTVHCHGYDPEYPDENVDGGELAHDDVCWRLREMFFGVLPGVVNSAPVRGELQYGGHKWVRDPNERRFGELLRSEFVVSFAIRSLPVYPKTPFTQEPTGQVVTPNGSVVTIVGGS